MGLFGSKDMCCICNERKGVAKLADGSICRQCMSAAGLFVPPTEGVSHKNITQLQMKKAISDNQKNKELLKIFTPTQKIGKFIEFDTVHGYWLIPTSLKFFEPPVRTFDDIVEYELLENGNSITKGGLGSAIVGGAAFGGVGAIVGGVTGKKKTKRTIDTFKIKITTKNIDNPIVYIDLLPNVRVDSGSIKYMNAYDTAQKILSVFASIKSQTGSNNTDNGKSEADEILKFKKLLDDGIITQEEFEAKKKQLLGI